MDVDGAGAAEVVVAPHLLEQLLAREHPTGVLRQELEQLELLEGQVEDPAAHLGGVGRVVDHDLAGPDDVGLRVGGLPGGVEPADRQLDPRLELGRTAGVEHDVVHAPVVGDDGETALGRDQDHRYVGAGRADEAAQVAGAGQVLTSVDEHQVGLGRLQEGAALGWQDLDVVTEQREAGQHLGGRLQGAGQK